MSDYQIRDLEIRDLTDEELEVIRKLAGNDDVTSVNISLGTGDDLLLKNPTAKVTPVELPEELEKEVAKAFAAAGCSPPCMWKRRSGGYVCVCP